MKGLNVRVNIVQRPQSADDAVGGSVRTDLPRYNDVLARISNKAQPTLLASQGFEGKDLHQIILWPDAYPDIEREDIVVPQNGRWASARFRVVEVQPSSVSPGMPRAHIQLMTERVRYAHENEPEVAGVASYDPVATLTNDINDTVWINIDYTSTGDPISIGDLIQVDIERMIVANVIIPTKRIWAVRAQQGTVAAAHSAGTEILRVL